MSNRGVNKVIIIGNLGADPDVRYTPNGDAIANLAVATSEVWKDKQTGELQEHTEWHRIVLFKNLAKVCADYVRKGTKIYVEGRLKKRKWKDKDGQEHETVEIIANEMHMLSGRSAPASSNTHQNYAESAMPPLESSHPDILDDDIPF